MNTMVSARVPVELRDQVTRKLKQSGSNTTELINAAYAEYARTGNMPGAGARKQSSLSDSPRALSAAQRKEFLSSIERSTLNAHVLAGASRLADASKKDLSAFDDYKNILAEGKLADYEALT